MDVPTETIGSFLCASRNPDRLFEKCFRDGGPRLSLPATAELGSVRLLGHCHVTAVHADAKRLCGSKRFTLDVGTPSAFGLPTLSKDIDEVVQKAPADNEWVKHALVKFFVGTGTVPRTTIGPCNGNTHDLWRSNACVRDPCDDVHTVSCLRIREDVRYFSSGTLRSLHQKFC